MKNIYTARFRPYYDESALPKFDKFLAETKAKFKTFEVVNIAVSNVRIYDQEITLIYSVDPMEEELIETKENLKQKEEYITFLFENEEEYKRRREYHLNKKAGKTRDYMGNVIDEESEGGK